MHFKPNFELRDICGERVLIANGIENIDFGALVHLNTTAADIYTHFNSSKFTLEEVVEYVTREYDIDEATATMDVKRLFDELSRNGILEQ